jgi:quercetin dioxygenase-like cupin family protein
MLELIYREGTIANEEVVFDKLNFPTILIEVALEKAGLGFIPHVHDVFEILYIAAGQTEIVRDNERYTAEPGDIFIFNSHDLHSCLYAEAGYASQCIQCDFTLLASQVFPAAASPRALRWV